MRTRVTAIAAGLVAVVGLAACGDGGGGTTAAPPTEIPATAFETIPLTVPTAGTGGGAALEGAFNYTVLRKDYAAGIAKKFKIKLSELAAANNWNDVNTVNLYPGDTIVIPGNGVRPSEPATDDTIDAGTDTEADAGTDTEATDRKNSDGTCNGTYTIQKTDTTRTKVAKRFDITVQELDAANANTKGYKAFYPSLKIVIPKEC